MTITKCVSDIERVNVPAGVSDCVRIDWIYDGFDAELGVTEFVTRDSVFLRRIVASNIEEVDPDNPLGTGKTFTAIKEYSLVSYKVLRRLNHRI